MPFLVSRSGLTQMGYEIAKQVGMTMIGRAVNKHSCCSTIPVALFSMPCIEGRMTNDQ